MDKEQKTEKKAWRKPELIVLLRGNPEESVLVGCKMAQSANSRRCSGRGACLNSTTVTS